MDTSKKSSHCLRAFDEIFVTLRLRCALIRTNRRHTEDERQTLRYLILKIWTIFNSTQIASNGAHAGDIYLKYRHISKV